jgi:16S rRNA C967 or C1407 C5-methylase (RsmB/RsmF family)
VSKPDTSSRGARGAAAFRDYYGGLFGERWPALEAALSAPPDSTAFAAGEGLEPYYLDSASVFTASCLELPDEGLVLDACAAPGGKSLVLASRLAPPSESGAGARLVANELSADRRRRLRDVLDRHLSPELRSRVEVTGRDAAAMCRAFESSFDAILLDAPCSSERHLLRQAGARSGSGGRADEAALAGWSPARVRGLAMRQWALLSSALIMLKAGGCLVYSTCALGRAENDGVIERALAKYGAGLALEPPVYSGRGDAEAIGGSGSFEGAEATEYGLAILPDRSEGAGPMYICKLRKIL